MTTACGVHRAPELCPARGLACRRSEYPLELIILLHFIVLFGIYSYVHSYARELLLDFVIYVVCQISRSGVNSVIQHPSFYKLILWWL